MKIKQPIVIMAAMAMGFTTQAQSLEEGVKMYQYERYESAKRALAPLAAGNPVANYYLGLAELALEHPNEAKDIFTKYPEDNANMAGLARVAFATNNVPEGSRLAGIVAGKAGKKGWEPLKLAADAITYTRGGNLQQAIDWYKEALKRNDNADTRIALGDAFVQTPGGGGEAMTNYEKVTAKDPKNSLAYSRIGELWYNARNYTDALQNFQKAKDADATNPLPYKSLANAYFWTGKYELAKQNIERYLEYSDKSTDDLINYSNILYLSKDYQKAIGTIQELLNKGVQKPGLYGILGFSQLELKDTVEALKNIGTYIRTQDAVKITKDDYIKFGRVLLENSQMDSANFYFTKAISMDTAQNKAETYRNIADAFKLKKGTANYAKAGEWYGKIVQENPATQILDYYYWGFWSYYGGKYDIATNAFQKMYERDSTQPSAAFWLGRSLATSDEEAKTGVAAPHFEKWFAMAGEKDKNLVKQAAKYLALYYYNKGDKAKSKENLDKVEAIDPNDDFLKQMKALDGKPRTGMK